MFDRIKCPYDYIEVTEGINENLNKEGKMRISIFFHLHNTLCLPEGVHKI